MTLTQERSTNGNSAAEFEALDAYSRIVTSVAEEVLPAVASLRVTKRARDGRRGAGAGSAGVITAGGFMLTSAPVIARADGGEAAVTDGREVEAGMGGAAAVAGL